MNHRSAFQRKYDAPPFDAESPFDAKAEMARQILLRAYLESFDTVSPKNGEELQAVCGGLLVGVIAAMMSSMPATDENHAHLRAGIIGLIPWAVDLMRQIDDLPPLPES